MFSYKYETISTRDGQIESCGIYNDRGYSFREQQISEVDKGLLVTNLHCTNFVNPPLGSIIGLSKDGLFIIEKGEIIGTAKNMRFTDEMPRILKDIEIGKEHKQPISMRGIKGIVASIKTKHFKFTSKTQH